MENFQEIFTSILSNTTTPLKSSPLFTSIFGPLLAFLSSLQMASIPDLQTIVLLLLMLFLSLKILEIAFRAVFSWLRMVLRFAFWTGVVVVGMWMYTRGVDGTVADLSWAWGFVGGWVEEEERKFDEFKRATEHGRSQQAAFDAVY